MLQLRLKPKAKQDLVEIFEFTAKSYGIAQAEKYQDDLFEGMLLLLDQDHLGKNYPYSDRPYRKLHVNRHLVFYRIEEKSCIIVRILHDRMDVRNHL